MVFAARSQIVLFAAFALLGCETPGERALTGGCPAGEICSDDTPDGLRFQGAPLAGLGHSVQQTAVGGIQRITVLADSGGGLFRFTSPFDASVDSPFSVSPYGTGRVEVAAEGAGSGYLRILDPNTGQLYDRVLLRAERVDRLAVGLKPGIFAPSYDNDVLLYASSEHRMVARLYARDGGRLVDEGLEIAAPGAELEREEWDLFVLDGLGSGDVEVSITTSAGDEHTFSFAVTDEIDAIEFDADASSYERGEPLALGTLTAICFHALVGDDVVAGLDWAYVAQGPIEVVHNGRCAWVEGLEAGTATLTASAAGLDYELAFDVAEPSGVRLLDAVPVYAESEPSPGDRARAAAAGTHLR